LCFKDESGYKSVLLQVLLQGFSRRERSSFQFDWTREYTESHCNTNSYVLQSLFWTAERSQKKEKE